MAAGDFRWNDHNIERAQRHGISVSEIEAVVLGAERGYPRSIGDGKYLVLGRGWGGRRVEVIFLRDRDDTLYVIHAQQISTRRKRWR